MRFNIMATERRVGLAGKLIVAGGLALGIGGVAEACGGGDDSPVNTGQRTETPSLMPSATALATQIVAIQIIYP